MHITAKHMCNNEQYPIDFIDTKSTQFNSANKTHVLFLFTIRRTEF